MDLLQSVYDHSPITFQNLMCSISGRLKYNERYLDGYWNARKFCKKFDEWPLDKQLEFQRKQLVEFIQFAVNNSPYYQRLYEGIDISSIKDVQDLKKLPVVDKEMLRANIEDVYTIPAKDAIIGNTGGTTGKSLTVRSTLADNNVRMAQLDHFKSRVGFENLRMKRATFNGKHIIPPSQKKSVFWRYNSPCRQMIYSSFHLTEDNIKYYVNSLNEFKPDAIDGFFTSICDVASYIERHNLNINFKPIAIFPTSETLTDDGRALIESVFHCKVYNQYASSEGAPFVTECKKQKMHIELNTGVFEFLDNGEILVTSFTTHGTPLIRYAIGDKMIPANKSEKCNCGLNGPIIKRIEGRKLDFLYKPDGAKINAGNVSNLLKYLPNSVIRTQFKQNELNQITILIEVDKQKFREESKNDILKECRHTFGNEMKVDIRVVETIPRADSGKFRMIINNVKHEEGT